MIFMVDKMNSINVLIDYLITAPKTSIRKLLKEADYCYEDIIEQYQKDFVSSEKLIKLIDRSNKYKDIQYFLIDIFFYVNEKSITDDVVDCCLKYPGKFKRTLVVQLSHIELSENQLLKLNAANINSEAFSNLVISYLKDDSCSLEKLSAFILDNIKYIDSIYNYKAYAKNSSVSNEKIAMIDGLLKQYRTEEI